MFNTNCASVPLVASIDGNGGNGGMNGWGDGGWLWIIVVFALLFGWGNNGWGGNGGGNGGANFIPYAVGSSYTDSAIQRGFDNQAVISKLDGITQGICDSTYALNNTLMNGFHGVDNAVCNLGYQTQSGFNAISNHIASCCCDTQRAIDGVNYNLATQSCDTRNTIQNATRDIIDGQNAGTRAILDFLTQDKIATLTAENQSLKFAQSQAAQTANFNTLQEAQTAELIRRLGRDCPVPAFVVPNPNCCYTPSQLYNGFGNNGCGCNC